MPVSLPPLPLQVPAGFDAAHSNARVSGPQVVQHAATSTAACAQACLTGDLKNCIAFNFIVGTRATALEAAPAPALAAAAAAVAVAEGVCELSSWGAEYLVMPNQSSTYYSKTLPRNDTRVAPKVRYVNRKTLPTENLLADTDGLLRPLYFA